MMGRLLAIPDCYSAMTTDRPYRKALSAEHALQEIQRGRAIKFDPEMVDAFQRVMQAISDGRVSLQSALQPVGLLCSLSAMSATCNGTLTPVSVA